MARALHSGRGVAPQEIIGQRVGFRPSRDDLPATYVVTALLPEKDGEFKHRIRQQGAYADLVVGERELQEARDR